VVSNTGLFEAEVICLSEPEPKVIGSSPIGRTNPATTYRNTFKAEIGVVRVWYRAPWAPALSLPPSQLVASG
jgi:hypothetical protein